MNITIESCIKVDPFNLCALELLESMGNTCPSEPKIQRVEKRLKQFYRQCNKRNKARMKRS